MLLLLLPLVQPDLDQYDGKAMSWRVLVFPLACMVVPVLWRATGSRAPYPYAADNLLVLMPLTDVLWNTLDAYDRMWGWDKLNHLGNSLILAAVIGLWAARYPLGPVNRFALALGLGMTLQVLWEICQSIERPSPSDDEESSASEVDEPDDGWCSEQDFDRYVKPRLRDLVGWDRPGDPHAPHSSEAYDTIHDLLLNWALHRPCRCCAERADEAWALIDVGEPAHA